MKRSLLALAALTAFAGAASAQSSVTLYGRVDLSMGKPIGSKTEFLGNGSGSRLGVRGVEDLGGGMKAIFNIEHRFEADTGVTGTGAGGGTSIVGNNAATNVRFWNGRSLVGLQGGWGEISLGREYTTAFLQNQLLADPWGWDTIVASGGSVAITGLGIGTVRNDSAITWKFAAGGLQLQAQYAEGTDTMVQRQNNPYNIAINYAAGPLLAGIGYEVTGVEGAAKAKMMSGLLRYNFGAFSLSGWYGVGDTSTNIERTGYNIGFVMPMGQGELRASYGARESDPAGAAASVTDNKLMALGYHYALSKRTTIYVDYARNSEALTEKNGYDFGLKHNF